MICARALMRFVRRQLGGRQGLHDVHVGPVLVMSWNTRCTVADVLQQTCACNTSNCSRTAGVARHELLGLAAMVRRLTARRSTMMMMMMMMGDRHYTTANTRYERIWWSTRVMGFIFIDEWRKSSAHRIETAKSWTQ
jgi:hypothetical protein